MSKSFVTSSKLGGADKLSGPFAGEAPAPRGRTQWVRNAEAAGEIVLKRGSVRQSFRLRAIPEAEKPPILKAYLDNFKAEVQRYFAVPAGSPAEQFAAVAGNYPAFELLAI